MRSLFDGVVGSDKEVSFCSDNMFSEVSSIDAKVCDVILAGYLLWIKINVSQCPCAAAMVK